VPTTVGSSCGLYRSYPRIQLGAEVAGPVIGSILRTIEDTGEVYDEAHITLTGHDTPGLLRRCSRPTIRWLCVICQRSRRSWLMNST
jgi:hypothetical protein